MHRRAFLHQSASLSLGAGLTMTVPLSAAEPTLQEFEAKQAARRKELWALLGDLPEPRAPKAKVIKTDKHDGFTLEHLELDLNGIEAVPAYLLIPDKRAKQAPGLLYIHAHGGTYGLGKEELILGRKVLPAYAPVCAAKGLVTLAIDSWCFSARKHEENGSQGEWDAFKLMLWKGQLLWGMMMFDEVQALTYLAGRPEVDAKRLGAFGLSMGATKAWWLAALDPRVRLCVDLCCLTDFEELIKIRNLKGHGIYYYVPKLLKHFQAHDINALIAPRPRLSLNGRKDLLTPPAGVERIRDHVLPLYAKYGRKDDCRIELFECGHEETPEMRKLVLESFDKYLT
ncbi:MAG: alpha/beta hydrolase family protein [Gemmataceae bacterium]|nr:alpha/beta hydrolase family protein [Gemmataceae bacterium]